MLPIIVLFLQLLALHHTFVDAPKLGVGLVFCNELLIQFPVDELVRFFERDVLSELK